MYIFYQKIVIFVHIFAVKYKFFENFCFPARNVLYTLEEVEIMLWVSAPIIYKPNITNSHLAHFIYFDYYFSQSGYKAFLQLYICKGYRYVA